MPLIGIVGNCYDRFLVRSLEGLGFQVYYIPCNVPGLDFDVERQRFIYGGNVLEKNGAMQVPTLTYSEDPDKIAKKESEIRLSPFVAPDFFIDRVADNKEQQLPLLRFLEQSGAVFLNSPDALAYSASKLRQAARFITEGIAFPESWVLPSTLTPFERQSALEEYFPVAAQGGEAILKLEKGARGTSIFFVNSMEEALRIAEEAAANGEGVVLQQPVVQEQTGTLRVNVVGAKAVNAFAQTAQDGAKISNNGEVAAATLSLDQENLAIAAVRALGLRFGGVDIIVDASGNSYVLEVNTAPDLQFFASESNRAPVEQVVSEILAVRDRGADMAAENLTLHPR